MFPGTKNRNEGTCGCSPVPKPEDEDTFAKTALLRNRPLFPLEQCELAFSFLRKKSFDCEETETFQDNLSLVFASQAFARQRFESVFASHSPR